MDQNRLKKSLLTSAAGFLLKAAAESNKTHRKIWIRDWRKRRNEQGAYNFIRKELLLTDPDSYRNYLRMDEETFQLLLRFVSPYIQKKDTTCREAISVSHKLTATLRFLATGESYQSMNYSFRISKSFLSTNIPIVCEAIFKALKEDFLKFPSTTDEWKTIADGFHSRWQFPMCLGAIDGKHVNFRASRQNDGAYYRNYKGFNSIVLMAVADADYSFIYIDVGCNGRNSDGGVLLSSSLQNIINNGDKHLPKNNTIGKNRTLPYIFIGDDAFALGKHLMKPYPFRSKEKSNRIFNYRLSRARRCVEHAFGILVNRFRVLLNPMDLLVENVEKVTLVSCVLHNFLAKKCKPYAEALGEDVSCPLQSLPANGNRYRNEAEKIRATFADFFVNEGRVSWQDKVVTL